MKHRCRCIGCNPLYGEPGLCVAQLNEGGTMLKPDPTPSLETLEYWAFDGVAEATDGCTVEPDGRCEHGNPSWLIKLGYI